MRLVTVGIAVGVVALLAGCAKEPAAPAAVSADRIRVVRGDIDRAVQDGATGMIATLTENGQTVTLTSGVADIETRAPIPAEPPQQVRVGSISKTFVSAVVLQLVAEGKIRLDEPVDTYLPGVLRGEGIDGRVITVRQILRHQSGLPELSDDPRVNEYRAAVDGRIMTPPEQLAIILSRPADFAPGARFEYSNSNYIVAGVLIERVTGAPYVDELDRRVLKPLALHDTYLPGPGDIDIRGPHPKGYADIDGVVTDVSRIEPSVPWAAGGMVATGNDLNRFYQALLAGQVVPAAELREMRTGVPMGQADMNYGLGLGSTYLPCGAEYVGHTGSIYGFLTISGATPDGRAMTYTYIKPPKATPDLTTLLSHALCP